MLSRINIIITWNSKKRAAAAVVPEVVLFRWKYCHLFEGGVLNSYSHFDMLYNGIHQGSFLYLKK
jgi:hypothetical protein